MLNSLPAYSNILCLDTTPRKPSSQSKMKSLKEQETPNIQRALIRLLGLTSASHHAGLWQPRTATPNTKKKPSQPSRQSLSLPAGQDFWDRLGDVAVQTCGTPTSQCPVFRPSQGRDLSSACFAFPAALVRCSLSLASHGKATST